MQGLPALLLLLRLGDAACDELAQGSPDPGPEISAEKVFGSTHDDVDLPMDQSLKARIRQELEADSEGLRHLVMEGESLAEVFSSDGSFDLFVDPLDGSLCFHKKGSSLGLPHCFVVTAMPARQGVKIGDALASLVVDFRNGDRYLAYRQGQEVVSQLNGRTCRSDLTARRIDGQHVFFFDTFYPETRQLLATVAGSDAGWFRNTGGAGYEMVCVGSGVAALFCSTHQKMHELAAAWLFNSGAGALATTLDARPLAKVSFDFEAQVDVAFFATDDLRQDFFRRLGR